MAKLAFKKGRFLFPNVFYTALVGDHTSAEDCGESCQIEGASAPFVTIAKRTWASSKSGKSATYAYLAAFRTGFIFDNGVFRAI